MPEITPGQKKEVALVAAALLVLALISLSLKGWSNHNVLPMFFAMLVLLAGYRFGPMIAWGFGLGGGIATVLLFVFSAISGDIFAVTLSLLFMCSVLPVPWVERHENSEKEFAETRRPLESQRETFENEVVTIRNEVKEAERRSRETDALYHIGREISKVLTLEDMLRFSRESIQDTLVGLVGDRDQGEFSFALLLEDEQDKNKFKAVSSWNLAEDSDEDLANSVKPGELAIWLKNKGEARLIEKVPAQKELKGLKTPPGTKAMASLPLVIRNEVMGFIMVFDTGGKLGEYLFNNLKILGSQISIGIEKTRLYDQVQKLSVTDGLTGLFVHRYFQERLDEELRRSERYGETLTLIMLDIDHFKRYNTVYGHLGGDYVLKEVAKILLAQVDETDIVARYGGEEFTVILSNQDQVKGLEKAEKIRLAIEKAVFKFEGEPGQVTISAGVAVYPKVAMTKKGLIDKADQALYRSKKEGRNRITLAEGA